MAIIALLQPHTVVEHHTVRRNGSVSTAEKQKRRLLAIHTFPFTFYSAPAMGSQIMPAANSVLITVAC